MPADESGGAGLTVVVAAAIVDRLAGPTRLLTARRSEPSSWAGWWEFPGGKVEPGEAPVAALHREIAEELGVAIRLGAELPGPATLSGGAVWPIMPGLVMRVWLAEVSAGVPTARDEHDGLRWLDAAQLDEPRWLPGDVPVIAALRPLLAPPG